MSTQHLRNVSIATLEAFLELAGCKFTGIAGGHAKYFRSDLNRPVIFQTHINPVPEFILKNILRSLGISKKQFWQVLEGKVIIEKRGSQYFLREK